MCREGVRGSGVNAPIILNLRSGIVSFGLRPLYPGERAAGTR